MKNLNGFIRAESMNISMKNLNGAECYLLSLFYGTSRSGKEEIEWSLTWPIDGTIGIQESYVNLIPYDARRNSRCWIQAGLTDAIRDFAEYRNLLPRGIKLSPEDVWYGISFILSVRLEDPPIFWAEERKAELKECNFLCIGCHQGCFYIVVKSVF
jgi:topoisomerase-4 subunit B